MSTEDREQILHGVLLENLKLSSDGYSYLKCHFSLSKNVLALKIENGGSVLHNRRIRITSFWSRFKALWITVLLLLLLLASIFLIPKMEREDKKSNESMAPQPKVDTVTVEAEMVETHTTSESVSNGLIEKQEPTLSIDREEEEETPSFFLADNEKIIYFSPNSSQLSVEGNQKIQYLSDYLTRFPAQKVLIAGHCAIAGTEKGRREISWDRANAVYKSLIECGWAPDNPPEIIGRAGDFPVTLDPEHQWLNRRVEIIFE